MPAPGPGRTAAAALPAERVKQVEQVERQGCVVWGSAHEARICYHSVAVEMSITLHIPDSVARSLRIPEGEAEQRLRQELAVALYARGLLSVGKASELAGTRRFLFADILTQRDIARHYGKEELAEDLTYAGGE